MPRIKSSDTAGTMAKQPVQAVPTTSAQPAPYKPSAPISQPDHRQLQKSTPVDQVARGVARRAEPARSVETRRHPAPTSPVNDPVQLKKSVGTKPRR